MNPKKLLILVLVLAILVLFNVFRKLDSTAKRSEAELLAAVKIGLVEKDLQPAFADRVEIRKGSDAITLAKTDSGWKIESRYGARAGSGQVENLIRKVSEAKGEQRADAADVLGDFELLDDQAYSIAISSNGAALARILVSQSRASVFENFVRAADSNKVLVTDTDFLSVLGIYSEGAVLDYKVFADLRVLPADVSKAVRFTVTQPGGSTITLVKKAGSEPAEWRFDTEAGAAAGAAEVSGFLSGLTNLFANDAEDPAAPDSGFNDAKPWLVLTENKDSKDTEYRLVLGARAGGNVLVKLLPENLVFRIPESQIDGLQKRDKASFAEPKPPAA